MSIVLNPSPDRLQAVLRPSFAVLGASGGIGQALVRHLLESYPRAQVVGTYRHQGQSLACLRSHYGDRLQLLPLDITQEEQIQALATALGELSPHYHGVINCIGLLHDQTLQPEKNLRQLQADALHTYFAVNSIGPILLAKYLLPLFRHTEPSYLAFLSAKVGSITDNHLGGWYGYRASKAALNMFIKTAAIEYRRVAPQSLLVLLHPGTTDTGLSQPFQKNVPPAKLFTPERTVAQLMTILQSLGPEDSGSFFNWDGSLLPW